VKKRDTTVAKLNSAVRQLRFESLLQARRVPYPSAFFPVQGQEAVNYAAAFSPIGFALLRFFLGGLYRCPRVERSVGVRITHKQLVNPN
jgi:hypothetical protein